MKKYLVLFTLLLFIGCGKSFDITEPPPNSKPKPTVEEIDYIKKYPDAIDAAEFNKDFLANQKDFKGKKVQVIGEISYHNVDETEDVDGKPEKRLYFVAADKAYPVACILEKGFTDEDIGKQKKGRVFEGVVFESYIGQVHLKPCKLLD